MTREERLERFLKYVEDGDEGGFKLAWDLIQDKVTCLNLQDDLFWVILKTISQGPKGPTVNVDAGDVVLKPGKITWHAQ